MGFLSPDYIKKNPKFPPAAQYQIVPNSILLLEPVISEAQIVYALDENGEDDIVMAGSQEILLTISQV